MKKHPFGTPQKHHILRLTRRKNRKKHLEATHIQQKIKKTPYMHNTRENTQIKNIIFHTHIYTVYTYTHNIPPKHPPEHTLINRSFGTHSGSFQNTEFGTC